MAVYKSDKPTKDGRSWFYRIYKDGKQYESKKYFTKRDALDEEALFKLKRDNPINKNFELILNDYLKETNVTQKYLTFNGKKRDL